MQVSKWGDTLAVRLPDSIVQALDLKEGDQLDLQLVDDGTVEISRKPKVSEALLRLRALRGALPADFRFDREELNMRGPDRPNERR